MNSTSALSSAWALGFRKFALRHLTPNKAEGRYITFCRKRSVYVGEELLAPGEGSGFARSYF